ncbi:MAG: PilZ domain-containing protein, partial [Deltaproteobacteria bacterium]
MEEQTIEKRKYPRVTIVVQVTAISSGLMQTCLSNDISPGGMFLETKEPFGIGELLNLEFSLPDVDRVFNLPAKVIRVVEEESERKEIIIAGMGVRFTELDRES